MMLARVIRAIIFDLDGTLVNSLPGIAASLNRVLDNNGLPTHPESAVRRFIGNGILKLVERGAPDHFSAAQVQQLTEAVAADYASSWQQGTTSYPGVAEVLHTLLAKGTGIAVLSNKPDVFCQHMTDFLFPDVTFSSVVGQREGVPVKPDPAGALEVARSLHLDPSEIAFVGDSTIDLATAQNAAMTSVAVSWGYHDLPALRSASPDHLIDHISQLPTIIKLNSAAGFTKTNANSKL